MPLYGLIKSDQLFLITFGFFKISGLSSFLISTSVGQALALNTFEGIDNSLVVVNLKTGPVVVAEVEFRQVAVQVI